jgi:hypothetical protein
MIKLDVCAARVPNMTRGQYSRYAKDNHARLVMNTDAVSCYIRCYIQHHVFDAAYGALTPPWRYDSVSHIFMDSIEDQMAIQSTREYREIIAPDEPHLPMPSRSSSLPSRNQHFRSSHLAGRPIDFCTTGERKKEQRRCFANHGLAHTRNLRRNPIQC